MDRTVAPTALLRGTTPTSRREILKRVATGAVATPALFETLAKDLGNPAQSVTTTKNQEDQPIRGGVLTLLGHHEIASLHPDEATPAVHRVMVAQIHNALVEQDENFVFQPVLATALPEESADGLTWTFRLHQGVKFHNGVEFTSADVKYTYEWYMTHQDALNHQFFADVASVEAPDPYTVVVSLTAPNAAFFVQIADTFIVPAAYHEELGKERYGAAPVGTGAFKLKEWRPADYTEVERFDEHFRGAPYLDRVRLNVVPEPAVRAIGLETGAADSSVWPLVTEDNLRLKRNTDQFKTFVTSSLWLNHFPLNNRHPILSDKRVRQAMMFAIDRQSIVDAIFLGAATLATANLSPALPNFYNPNVPQYPYDPVRAAALLDGAGWVRDGDIREKDGNPLAFTCTTISGDSTRRQEAELVQQYLAEAGIEMGIDEAPLATIIAKLRAAQMDSSLFNAPYGGEQGDPDATAFLVTGASNNFSHFENAEVDDLMEQGLRERDPAKRAAIYHRIQVIVAEEVPFLFMMFWDWYEIFSTRIKGLPDSYLTDAAIYSKAYRWWKETRP